MKPKPSNALRKGLESFFKLTNWYHKSVLQERYFNLLTGRERRIFGARSFSCFSLGCQFLVEFLLVDLLGLAKIYVFVALST